MSDYEADRDNPSIEGTSRLSPHLHWGEISPTQLWMALEGRRGRGAQSFRSELLWRDYAQNVICRFPDCPEKLIGHLEARERALAAFRDM